MSRCLRCIGLDFACYLCLIYAACTCAIFRSAKIQNYQFSFQRNRCSSKWWIVGLFHTTVGFSHLRSKVTWSFNRWCSPQMTKEDFCKMFEPLLSENMSQKSQWQMWAVCVLLTPLQRHAFLSVLGKFPLSGEKRLKGIWRNEKNESQSSHCPVWWDSVSQRPEQSRDVFWKLHFFRLLFVGCKAWFLLQVSPKNEAACFPEFWTLKLPLGLNCGVIGIGHCVLLSSEETMRDCLGVTSEFRVAKRKGEMCAGKTGELIRQMGRSTLLQSGEVSALPWLVWRQWVCWRNGSKMNSFCEM